MNNEHEIIKIEKEIEEIKSLLENATYEIEMFSFGLKVYNKSTSKSNINEDFVKSMIHDIDKEVFEISEIEDFTITLDKILISVEFLHRGNLVRRKITTSVEECDRMTSLGIDPYNQLVDVLIQDVIDGKEKDLKKSIENYERYLAQKIHKSKYQ